jgi:hypothetical protein
VRLHHGWQSHEVIVLSATGHLGMAASGQIRLTVVISVARERRLPDGQRDLPGREIVFGINAEGKPLEEIAAPLTMAKT